MTAQLPALPLGLSEFAVLREAGADYLYVDKTRQLAELLAAGKYLFLARPRRFGKSLLCSTMRCLYEGRRDLFAGLAIEPEWDWTKPHPVVHISLTVVPSRTVEQTDKGRLDAVLKTRAAIYVIEFKLGRAEDALAQIEARGYHEPYLADGRPVVLLGAGGFAEKQVRCLWKDMPHAAE